MFPSDYWSLVPEPNYGAHIYISSWAAIFAAYSTFTPYFIDTFAASSAAPPFILITLLLEYSVCERSLFRTNLRVDALFLFPPPIST